MKRLAVSLAGEGFGHVSRILALLPQLIKEYEVSLWCPDHVKHKFFRFIPENRIYPIPFLRLFKKNNTIQYFETAIYNIKYLIKAITIISDLKKQLHKLKINAVLSDYEPFLTHTARRLKLPLVLINHQGVLDQERSFKPDAIVAKIINYLIIPRDEKLIICSFFNGDVGPLIREELKNQKVFNEDFILVYVKDNIKQKVINILNNFPEQTFRIFPNKDDNFDIALTSCKGVISPAGHQLISECLFFGKPALVIPEKMQYEQKLNAKMLEKSGYGIQTDMKNFELDLRIFLNELDTFPRNSIDKKIKFTFDDDSKKAFEMIHDFIKLKISTQKLLKVS